VTVTAALPNTELANATVVAVPMRPYDGAVGGLGAELLGAAPADLDGVLAREEAKGAPGEVVSVPLIGQEPLERVLVFGTGDAGPPALRKAGAALARRAKKSASLVVDLRGLPLDRAAVAALTEGLLLASYTFTTLDEAEPRALQSVTLVGDLDADAVREATVIATATAAARDLVNTPSLQKSPDWLAQAAVSLLSGLKVKVRNEKALKAEGFGGILGVGQGSTRPPRLVEATYDGGGSRHVVLIGKGITFDTGGLSLKPLDGMLAMKTDMGGAAAVLATLRAVADLQLPIKVTVLAAIAENMPSGTAHRPSDVLTQYGGRTVEVLNTDAEGRLVLADAIAYAEKRLAPDVIVDIATLTGAMPIALGKRVAGLFASDDALAAALLAAAEASGEAAWRLPLTEDYRVALDSGTADLRNIGNPKRKFQGGSITAALFLREFTGGLPWAHLDIAGTGRSDSEEHELSKGGTGYGVRLLTRWLQTESSKNERSTDAAATGRRKTARSKRSA
ncbi:MAG TPA: leucyl aminopeptidase, partial [Mycobacteriales bacterium]|nr:leucyl aminopeptidase [Mycobacteriales bacterium]